MIVTWMAWAALFAGVAALAALAGERLLAIWGLPRRGAWMAAMALSLAVPAGLAARRAPAGRVTPPASVASTPAFSSPRIETRESIAISPEQSRIDVPEIVLGAWIGVSAILLAMIGISFLIVRRAARRWPVMEVDGHVVRVAPTAGPAVVGAIRPTIVLPAWAIELGAADRALMLRHEEEHVRAGDPRLLLIAACCTALMPWNAALWFVARRLRLAIEIDCDARVLRGVSHAREYGLLLLTVGARRGASLPLAASLVERRPLIERRIVAMTSRRPSRPMLASLPALALVLAAGVLVAQAPQPAPLRPSAAPAIPAAAAAPAAPAASAAPAVAPRGQPAPPLAPSPALAPASKAAPVAAPQPPVDAAAPTPAAAPAPALLLSRSPARHPEIPDTTIRRWIQIMQPALLQGDTSNAIVFVLNADNEVVRSDVGYDRGLTDRMKTIAARQAMALGRNPAVYRGDSVMIDSQATVAAAGTMRGRISGPGSVAPTMSPGSAGGGVVSRGRISGPGTSNVRVTGQRLQFFDRDSAMFPKLDIPSDQIERLEVRNNNGGILDRPLEVVIIWLKAA